MDLNINWTTVISSAVVAVVIGSVQIVANRYLIRILDRIEKKIKRGEDDVKQVKGP